MSEFNNTFYGVDRLTRQGRIRNGLDNRLYYQDRPIIGKDSTINGGVYIGTGNREAIVVDLDKSPVLQNMLDTVKRTTGYNRERREFNKNQLMDGVFDAVRTQILINSSRELDSFIIQRDLRGDKKVNLDLFFTNGIGVCRHMALGMGVMIERLIQDGHLNGHISVDRNFIPERGSHAWCRFTNPNNKVYIFDPQKNIRDSMQNLMRKRMDNKSVWAYARESDFEA